VHQRLSYTRQLSYFYRDAGTLASSHILARFPARQYWVARGSWQQGSRPGGNTEANLKSISHRCHPVLVAFVWELTEETIYLPLGCLQGGEAHLLFGDPRRSCFGIASLGKPSSSRRRRPSQSCCTTAASECLGRCACLSPSPRNTRCCPPVLYTQPPSCKLGHDRPNQERALVGRARNAVPKISAPAHELGGRAPSTPASTRTLSPIAPRARQLGDAPAPGPRNPSLCRCSLW